MTAKPASISLDLRGLQCPLPALRTRKVLRKLAPGELLIVECTDPLAMIDIPHLLHETGDTLDHQDAGDGLYIFHIRRKHYERTRLWQHLGQMAGPRMEDRLERDYP